MKVCPNCKTRERHLLRAYCRPCDRKLQAAWKRGQHKAKQARTTPSPKELEVLSLVAQGMTHKQIGRLIERGPRTVKARLDNLRRISGAKNSAQLIVWAIDRGHYETPGQRRTVERVGHNGHAEAI